MPTDHWPEPVLSGSARRRDRTSPLPPDFLILGAQKCGTTSLAAALRSHPDVFVPQAKEAQHFGRVADAAAGGPDYLAFFDRWGGEPVVGEATPDYLWSGRAAAQIASALPEVKGIAVLRNPVDRAYSAFWNGRRIGRLKGGFREAVADELDGGQSPPGWFRDLVDRGRYAEQLQRYLEQGFGSDRLLVVLFEEVVADEAGALRTVQEFLGVDAIVTSLPRLNEAARSWLPRSVRSFAAPHYTRRTVSFMDRVTRRPFTPPPMDPAVRARLVEYYRPHNARLAELLGRDLPDWDR